MYDACHTYFAEVHVAIASAAVADYKPKMVSNQKIKKTETHFSIELEQTQDILASLGAIKKEQFLIGFALETEIALLIIPEFDVENVYLSNTSPILAILEDLLDYH